MGFLSRKTKNKSATAEEPHPIFEELERMEEAVPERLLDSDPELEDESDPPPEPEPPPARSAPPDLLPSRWWRLLLSP